MNKLLLRLAITAAASGPLSSNSMVAQLSPTTPKAASVRITQGPEIELAKDFLTIIRWTTNNPGGSPEHYGIVHHGTDPKNLSQTAKNPITLNPNHPATLFRVRVEGLKPGTTYYYTVDSEESNGTSDRVNSPVKQFTTEPPPRAASAR
jgi:phosphodiesterase/alkaline phosphatase D-like protein